MAKPHQTFFTRFARVTSNAAGGPIIFMIAVGVIVVWAITGPIFAFSDTWQLVINTGTSVVTFLMVFLIQNSQTRDSLAVQVKLDELIKALEGARNELIDVEDLDPKELQNRREEMVREARRAKKATKAVDDQTAKNAGTQKTTRTTSRPSSRKKSS